MREEDEEDDDVSLLSFAMPTEPEAEEDEVDDVSLLAADIQPEPDTKREETPLDHLEGMTAEMFWGDGEFESDFHKEDEEVEALPDTQYGLLGCNKVLQEPQGCIDDLPEEVLRQVLCQVPARDLYCSVSLVCHHWRNIVQDPKVTQTTVTLSHVLSAGWGLMLKLSNIILA